MMGSSHPTRAVTTLSSMWSLEVSAVKRFCNSPVVPLQFPAPVPRAVRRVSQDAGRSSGRSAVLKPWPISSGTSEHRFPAAAKKAADAP